MQSFIALAAAFLAVGLVACGGGDDSTEDAIEARIEAYQATPKVIPPDGPPPKKVVFEDVKVGSGPIAQRGDRVALHYVAVVLKNGEDFSYRWEPDPPVVYPRLGEGQFPGLEKGIEGMREGGRREVVVPNYAADGVVYLVDLESVEPTGQRAAAS
ncbi:MAG TPA: FKBP-type peptidyl-prolyl cis-trans isomerase [Solirubrobacterales bacterium]|nr:FKBP-type peptidyl-prolyl cis-trans isomerase [Solirubrobacterales bacterium]